MPVVRVKTAAAEKPVTIAELKSHLRLVAEDGSQDTLLTNLIAAATSLLERQTRRAFVTRTLQIFFDRFPAGSTLYLPRPPLRPHDAGTDPITITYLDEDGATQTLAAADYHIDANHEPGRIQLDPAASWPTTLAIGGAVTIECNAGYGARSAVPDDIKHAILLLAAHWYDHPQAASELSLSNAPLALDTIVTEYRMPEEV